MFSTGSFGVPVVVSSVNHTLVQPLREIDSIRISLLDLQEMGCGGMDWLTKGTGGRHL